MAIGRTIKRQPSIAISANQVADDDDDDDNDNDDDDNDDGDDAVMREQSIFCNIDFPGPGFHLPSLFLGARGAEKGAHNPDRPPATMPGVSSTYPEVQPGCTECRAHPGCTEVIATTIKRDVEYSRWAELAPFRWRHCLHRPPLDERTVATFEHSNRLPTNRHWARVTSGG